MRIFLLSTLLSFVASLSFAVKDPACSSSSGAAALIVIDMQPAFAALGGNSQRPENKLKMEKLISEQKKAIKEAQAAGIPIVFFEYETTAFPVDGTDAQLLGAATKGYRDVRVLKKTTDGMFDSSNKYLKDLQEFLKRNQIGTLIIAGANGGACVQESIKGALKNNCNVVAFTSGIADFNYRDFIYPYVGQYSGMKKLEKDCNNCTFKEVASVDSAANSMMGSRATAPAGGGSKTATGKR